MSKLNINFKKSNWKSKKKINLNYITDKINFESTLLYSDAKSLIGRNLHTSFEDLGLKFSKNFHASFKIIGDFTELSTLQLKIIGHNFDLTTPSYGQKKFRNNFKILLDDIISFEKPFRLEFKILTKEDCSSIKRKEIKKAFKIIYYKLMENKNINDFIILLSTGELEKKIIEDLKSNFNEIYKCVCLKSKEL